MKLEKVVATVLCASIIIGSAANISYADLDNENFNAVEESKYTFYCEDSPQNRCGKTEVVDCAVQDLLSKIKTSVDLHLSQLNVGNNCKTDVHVWKYDGLAPFIRAVENYLSGENKETAFNWYNSDWSIRSTFWISY